jgi:hypothetical protein
MMIMLLFVEDGHDEVRDHGEELLTTVSWSRAFAGFAFCFHASTTSLGHRYCSTRSHHPSVLCTLLTASALVDDDDDDDVDYESAVVDGDG